MVLCSIDLVSARTIFLSCEVYPWLDTEVIVCSRSNSRERRQKIRLKYKVLWWGEIVEEKSPWMSSKWELLSFSLPVCLCLYDTVMERTHYREDVCPLDNVAMYISVYGLVPPFCNI